MTLLLLLLLVLQSRGELMAGEMDLRKPRLGEYTALSSSCLCQYPPEVSHCLPNRIGSLKKGLNFIRNDVFMLLKCDENCNW